MANKKILQAVTAISKPGFIVEEKTFDSNANVLRLKISINKISTEQNIEVVFNSNFNYDYIFWGDNTYSTAFLFDEEGKVIGRKDTLPHTHTYKIPATEKADASIIYDIVITNIDNLINKISTTPESNFISGASLVEINCGNNIKFDTALFQNVATLTKIIGLNEVSDNCFNRCTALSQVIFDDDFYSMGVDAFKDTSIESMIVSANLMKWNSVPSNIKIYYKGLKSKAVSKDKDGNEIKHLFGDQTLVYYYTCNEKDRKDPGTYWYYTEDGLIAEVTVNTQ